MYMSVCNLLSKKRKPETFYLSLLFLHFLLCSVVHLDVLIIVVNSFCVKPYSNLVWTETSVAMDTSSAKILILSGKDVSKLLN